MLVDEPKGELLNVIMAVEDDLAIPAAQKIAAALRQNKLSTDMIATGSARKRYDKATKINAYVLMSVRWNDGVPAVRTQSADANVVVVQVKAILDGLGYQNRSEEHTSELQSLMRISFAVFCLNNKHHIQHNK